ncbi:MAG: sugar phosphate isomerase/epimerase family protein [Methanoregulaceae archaeon]
MLTMNGTTEFGCSTYACMDLPLYEALVKIREKTGLIEILSDGPHDLFRHIDACHDVDARYTVHAPGTDINLGSTNDRIRSFGIQVLDELCGICDLLNAENLVVHPGYTAWSQSAGESQAAFLRSLADLSRLQEEHDVRIAVENMGSWECCHFRTPDTLPQIVNLGLGYTLDVGHAHLNHVLREFAESAPPTHIHLHDNGGTVDDHAACGTGTIDFPSLLPRLPEDIPCILEVKSLEEFDESIRYLSGIGPEPGNRTGSANRDGPGEGNPGKV